MKTCLHLTSRLSFGLAMLALITIATSAQAAQTGGAIEPVDIWASSDGTIVFFTTDTDRTLLSFTVRVVGPNRYLHEERVEQEFAIDWELPPELSSGSYSWEARAVTADPSAPMRSSLENLHPEVRIEHLFEFEYQQAHVASGTFRIEGGAIDFPNQTLEEDDDRSAVQRIAAAIGDFLLPSAHAQLRLRSSDEVTVGPVSGADDGRFIVRSTDVDEYAFRVQVGGPSTRFAVVANGGTGIGNFWNSGAVPDRGLRVWGDTELDSNLTVGGNLNINGNFVGTAQFSGSTFINGNLGVGTGSAARRVTSSSTGCQYRLEHDSKDSVYQLCAGVGANDGFEILGSKTGSTIARPFRIDGEAPTNSLVVSATGLGIGTAAPAASFHVSRANNTSRILVEESGASNQQEMLRLKKNGAPLFILEDAAQNTSWTFRTGGVVGTVSEGFIISKIGTGVPEMLLRANGDLQINGTLIELSSRDRKQNIQTPAYASILDKLNRLDIPQWSYTASPESMHIGPIAEEFFDLFGYGLNDETISPRDIAGVALAAVKALKSENVELQQRIAALEARSGL